MREHRIATEIGCCSADLMQVQPGMVVAMSTTLPYCTFMMGYTMPECSSRAAATSRRSWTDFQQHGGTVAVLRTVLKQHYRRMTSYVSIQTYPQVYYLGDSAQPSLHVAVQFRIRLVHLINRLLRSMASLPTCLEHLELHLHCSAVTQSWFVQVFSAMPQRLKMLTLTAGRKASAARVGRPIEWPTHLVMLRCKFYCTDWTFSHWYEILSNLPEGLRRAEFCFRYVATLAAINDVCQIIQDGRRIPAPGFHITFKLTDERVMARALLDMDRLRASFHASGWELQLT